MNAKLLALFALGQLAAGAINKPLISPKMPALDQGLLSYLTPTQSTHDQWEWGWIPQACKDLVEGEGLSPYDVEVFNIHYTDCQDVWIMCRHHNAGVSQIQMIDIFGRMPVHMRQYVRHIVAVPGTLSAASGGDNIILRGTGPNIMTIFVHETAHSMDSHAVPGTTAPFHDSVPWQTAVNKDTAICDDYALTSHAENFAQETVVALWDKVVPGGIGTIQPSWASIYNQYTAVQNWLGDQLLPGGTCQKRLENSPPVSMGPATGFGRLRSRSDKPDVSLSKGMEVIPEIPMGELEFHDW